MKKVWNKGLKLSKEKYPNFGSRTYNAPKEDAQVRKKISVSMKKYFFEHPKAKEVFKTKKHKLKKRLQALNQFKNGMCEGTKKKLSDAITLWHRNNPHIAKEHSKRMKNNWKNPTHIYNSKEFLEKRNIIKKPTKLELKLMAILNKNYPNQWRYVGNGKLWFNRMNPDFIHKKENLVIELFSTFWHTTKGKKWYGTKDDSLDRTLAFDDVGFICIPIFEEMMKDESKILNQINGRYCLEETR